MLIIMAGDETVVKAFKVKRHRTYVILLFLLCRAWQGTPGYQILTSLVSRQGRNSRFKPLYNDWQIAHLPIELRTSAESQVWNIFNKLFTYPMPPFLYGDTRCWTKITIHFTYFPGITGVFLTSACWKRQCRCVRKTDRFVSRKLTYSQRWQQKS